MQQRAVAEPWHQPPREAAFPGQVMPTDPLFTCRNSTAAGLTTLAQGKNNNNRKNTKKGIAKWKVLQEPLSLGREGRAAPGAPVPFLPPAAPALLHPKGRDEGEEWW